MAHIFALVVEHAFEKVLGVVAPCSFYDGYYIDIVTCSFILQGKIEERFTVERQSVVTSAYVSSAKPLLACMEVPFCHLCCQVPNPETIEASIEAWPKETESFLQVLLKLDSTFGVHMPSIPPVWAIKVTFFSLL